MPQKGVSMTNLSWWKKTCAVLLLCAATAIASQAQTFTTLASFNGTNGQAPFYVSLIQGPDGSLYGTTIGGGTNERGTVFRMTPSDSLKVLYSFCSQTNCADGEQPEAGLVLDTDGNFYGTTGSGGSLSCPVFGTCGTVFKLTREGILTSLHSFSGLDGAIPLAPLVEALDGTLYGVTDAGGTGTSCPGGCGTAFEISSSGVLTSLHSFDFHVDGQAPNGPLLQAPNGSFYGTTLDCDCQQGTQGTLFNMTASGGVTTLYAGILDTRSGLILGNDGNLYGTAGFGYVYKSTLQGSVTTFASVAGQPWAGLLQATDGNFYGTTIYGGDTNCDFPNGCGSIFQVTQQGVVAVLHEFEQTDGSAPYGGLSQATNGKLYGTTAGGGANGDGTVYQLDMGLAPFIAFVRAAGKVGQTGGILGQGFTGTTSVSLNGILASFTVVSDTFIRATVPSGATTGYVTVTTPSGTLTSNVPFHVIP